MVFVLEVLEVVDLEVALVDFQGSDHGLVDCESRP